jgi:hypothetical protein
MGLTQTKLHRAVIQGDWVKTLRCLQKHKDYAMVANPYSDYPIHLACYGGKAPPYIIRELILACPDAVTMKNKKGYDPLQLAEINYRRDDPNRAQVLAMLHMTVDARLCTNKYDDETGTESSVQSITMWVN